MSAATNGAPGGEQCAGDRARPARLRALDVLRGATIAGMILVNNPGSWGHIYAPLKHAAWHGCTPTDLVFPFFLFMVGVSIPLALGRRVDAADGARSAAVPKVLRRGVVLFALGLLLAGFPTFDLEKIRIMGVLQRIAVCYVGASLLFLFTSARTQGLVALVCLLGYWPLLVLTPVPGGGAPDIATQGEHIAGWVDRAVLGAHTWGGKVYDPEGLLSTIPALGTALLGVFVGALLRRQRSLLAVTRTLALAGTALTLVGWLWGQVFPINKPLWTSSYAVFTGGLAMLALAGCIALFDLGADSRGKRALARPFVVFGVNAITVFVGSGLLGRCLGRLWKLDDGRTVQQTFYAWLQANLHLSPIQASLCYALVWVSAWYIALEVLYRRNIVIRV
ncbi:MAG: heparan-alpha-glucosaminide N-acetyltransferase domain-containing protein [Planctomycetota bacterium]